MERVFILVKSFITFYCDGWHELITMLDYNSLTRSAYFKLLSAFKDTLKQ